MRERAALVVAKAAGVATIQDEGRGAWLSRGMPPSGPLDPETFSAANRAVGNAPGAAAIELLVGSLVLRARGALVVSIDGDAPVRLQDGEELRVAEGPFAVRIHERDAATALDVASFARRLEAAFALRARLFDGAETDAYRLVNGEGDRIPGLVIDRYRDTAVLRLDGDALARASGAEIAAHPSYPDRAGFGRTSPEGAIDVGGSTTIDAGNARPAGDAGHGFTGGPLGYG